MTQRCFAIFLVLGLGLAAAQGPAIAGISADPTGPTVTVRSPPELERAYLDLSAWANGGGTVLLAADFPATAEINLIGGGSNPVHITSADPQIQVRISRIAFDDVDNVRVSNVHVDSTGVERLDFFRDMDITNSSRIEISDSTFTSNGLSFFDLNDPSTVLGERLSMVRYSEDITVSNNYISGYEHGLTFQESTNIRISGNEITAMQGDGIRLAGVQDVLVADNHMHDFSGTPNEFTHSDFIQMWSRNADIVSRDVTITGNVLDTGNGVAMQAIWIGNTEYRNGTSNYVYENITVTDNLIYSGAAQGIGVEGANNVLVANNTLLWNPDAVVIKADGDTSYEPRINLQGVTNGEVTNNIAPRILSDEDVTLQGNVIVSYTPGDPNYVGNHFVNAAEGGDIGPAGWQLLENSPFVGTGANASQPNGADPLPEPVAQCSDLTRQGLSCAIILP